MRFAWAIGLIAATAACGDDNNNNGDNTFPDDSRLPGDAVVVDAPPDATPLAPCTTPVSGSTITTRRIGGVTGAAMLATAPPNDPRLFVVEKQGRIRIFENEVLREVPFLDFTDEGPVIGGDENGLLGLAFHPEYHVNRTFFVFYTADDLSGATNQRNVVARCTASAADPNVADPTCTEILSIPDFAPNHNGGMIEFGPDNFLYISTGDGGGGGDPQRTAQNPNSLLGKMLRIDVNAPSGGKEYGIPSTNPYLAGGGAQEVYAIGLRNPWRWSFDRETGDIYIGDVGQGRIEELNVIPAGELGSKNFGWSIFEGSGCCETQGDRCTQSAPFQSCTAAPEVFVPQDERTHAAGWISIVAGEVYRGTCYPDLEGWFLYTDYGRGGLVKARRNPDNSLEIVDLTGSFPSNPASIHGDARGELFITTTNGSVFAVEAGP